ncbi:hypothetical protein D2V17_10505 [Aurantiacibacter xanthus]|uniref:PepSY domain-containing protein n=1 Tax=Aurantiacibacter xanthus TaxID=1784712 RepID=A0A3A1P7J1_9SPHN|nr:PepSY domain-containing protein [Aurantiacibacter xanthus]RIV85513.1 hypothetical protein D2V17_10505 [Aurantiacibacter xanthus]
MVWTATKRWLYLTHRWIGIATCLLFVLWFVSGLVMLYIPFPSLDEEEELAGLAPIAWEQVEHGPFEQGSGLRKVVLEMRDGRPIWRVAPWEGESYSIWADSGRSPTPVGRAEALRIASGFGGAEVQAMRRIYNDQWSVPGGFDRHRPLWKAELAGDAGRVLYVSSTSGEVVLDTDRNERFWNWLGSVPHWLYPRALREDQPLWRQVVLWVSGPCIVVGLTGIWIGLMRLRAGKRRFKGGRMTPYRGWMKWHHVSGLVGSVFLILWIFSGWLSVDPFRLFASEGIAQEARRDYMGAAALPVPDLALMQRLAPDARRVEVSSAVGQPLVRLYQPASDSPALDPRTGAAFAVPEQTILAAAAKLVPEAQIASVTTLTRPDAYWYSVKGDAPLPVLRIRFTDPAHTWVHIDPVTGELLGHSDTRRRVYRWLFDLFHRWDLNLLLSAFPARDVVIWLMSIAGLISSVTAVYVGWVRLRRSPARQPSVARRSNSA